MVRNGRFPLEELPAKTEILQTKMCICQIHTNGEVLVLPIYMQICIPAYVCKYIYILCAHGLSCHHIQWVQQTQIYNLPEIRLIKPTQTQTIGQCPAKLNGVWTCHFFQMALMTIKPPNVQSSSNTHFLSSQVAYPMNLKKWPCAHRLQQQ